MLDERAAETIRAFLFLEIGLYSGLRQKNLRELVHCKRGDPRTAERWVPLSDWRGNAATHALCLVFDSCARRLNVLKNAAVRIASTETTMTAKGSCSGFGSGVAR